MKNISILIVICLLALSSCDKRKDFWNENNGTPGLPISTSENFWSHTNEFRYEFHDSLKMSKIYRMLYAAWDDAPGLMVKIGNLQHGDIFYNDSEVAYDEYFNLSSEYGVFEYHPTSQGFETISITCKDGYNAQSTTTIDLMVFENFLPDVSFNVSLLGNLDAREYKIDASETFDVDDFYGGEIIAFEYVVDSDTTIFPHNTMNYIFPADGSYIISVRAMDNDSAWSAYQTIGGFIVN